MGSISYITKDATGIFRMNKAELVFGIISIALCLLISSATYAADVEAGRVVSTQCAICHGPSGEGNGLPKSCIACIDADTFIKYIHEFQTGSRKNYMMEMFAKRLSEEDIENLAAYYAR